MVKVTEAVFCRKRILMSQGECRLLPLFTLLVNQLIQRTECDDETDKVLNFERSRLWGGVSYTTGLQRWRYGHRRSVVKP